MGLADTLNKGLPYETNLSVNAEDMEEICATDRISFHYKISQDFGLIMKKLSQRYNIPFGNMGWVIQFTVDNNLNRKVVLDSVSFLWAIVYILNIDDNVVTLDALTKEIRASLNELNKIKTERELEMKFPTLYKVIYCDLIEDRDAYIEYRKNNKEKNMPSEVLEQMRAENKEYLNQLKNYGLNTLNFNFKNFKDGIYKTLNDLFKNFLNDKLENDCKKYTIDFDKYGDCIDKDKFELLIAVKHMIYVTHLKSNSDEMITSVSYLAQFFAEHEMDLNNVTKISYDEKEYTIKSLYEEFKQFLLANPKVKIIRKNVTDFEGQTLEDVKKYIEQYKNELSVSWEILPSGVLQYSDAISQNTSANEDENKDEIKAAIREKKEKMLSEKEEFFKKHEPYLVLLGKESFKGYIGHVYPNAYVVLEKFYKNTNCTSIASEAIYIMNVDEFVTLSVKSKPEIIENHLCHRVTHHRGWQGRVEEILKKSPDLNSIEKVQIFENAIRQSK